MEKTKPLHVCECLLTRGEQTAVARPHPKESELPKLTTPTVYQGRLSRSEFHEGQVPLKARGSCSWCWYS